MKRIKTGSKMAAKPKEKMCDHSDTHPAAAFLDDKLEEAWMLQVCDTCGAHFFLLGVWHPTISE